jgi:pSer/pThr/pTyr-binding forkhead associated (FHA) protein
LPASFQGLSVSVYSIGRAPDCDVCLADKSVSQYHAQLIVEGERVFLVDLESRNGTRVGRIDNRVASCELQADVSVYFGKVKVAAQTLLDSIRPKG